VAPSSKANNHIIVLRKIMCFVIANDLMTNLKIELIASKRSHQRLALKIQEFAL
jgi:hypothetical protein